MRPPSRVLNWASGISFRGDGVVLGEDRFQSCESGGIDTAGNDFDSGGQNTPQRFDNPDESPW